MFNLKKWWPLNKQKEPEQKTEPSKETPKETEVEKENVSPVERERFSLTFYVDNEDNFGIECFVDDKISDETMDGAIILMSQLLTPAFDYLVQNFLEFQDDEALAFLELFLQARQLEENSPLVNPLEVFNVDNGQNN